MKKKFCKMAEQEAKKSTYHHRVGAVVVQGNRLVSRGHNKPQKTHPKSSNPFRTIHAELAAIINLSPEQLEGATIYVFRWTEGWNPGLAKPCPYCAQMLRDLGVETVVFSTGDPAEPFKAVEMTG